MRLIRERPSHDREATIGTLQRVVDAAVSPMRAEKLSDEAQRARELTGMAIECGRVASLPSSYDVVDASALSLWLAARLPFTPRLLTDIIGATCPLARLQGVVDALRLLVEPCPRRFRPFHRLRLEEDPAGRLLVDRNVEK